MKLVIQRVSEASVAIQDSSPGTPRISTVASIRTGLAVLVGIARDDSEIDAGYLSDKLLGLRIFPDEEGKMNRSVVEAGGSLLVVSQFTLYGDCRRGRRPSFDQAAPPDRARALYDYFIEVLRRGPVPVESGVFQAMMEVRLINQGPVTILMDSTDRTRK